MAVFVALAMYLVVGAEFLRFTTPPEIETAARVVVSSQMPVLAGIGPVFSERVPSIQVIASSGNPYTVRRCPSVIDTARCDENMPDYDPEYQEGVDVNVSVSAIAYDVEPTRTLNCDTELATSLAGTLDALRVADPCTPMLVYAGNQTNDQGQAFFRDFRVASGPPARYTWRLTPGDGVEVTQQSSLVSETYSIDVQGGASGVVATLGQPLSSQPRVIVRDYRGTPLADRTVVVWSSNVPNIFVSSQPHVGFSAQDTAAVGKLTHYVRGQDIALLSGNRAVTDADGVATWEALTIEAASSRFVYLNFYCDGVIASWNNPDLRPPISGQLLPPPAFVPPIYALSLVDEMYQLPSAPPPDASGSGGGVGVPSLSLDTPLTCSPGTTTTVLEGDPLDETIRVRVGRSASGAFVPEQGVTLLALMHTASGYVLPNLFRPDNSLLRSANPPRVLSSLKRLTNAVSTPSDADGVATFPRLGFSLEGREDATSAAAGYETATHHRIAFCTAGTGGLGSERGCTLSCPITVMSRLAEIEWAAFPQVVRALRSEALAPSPGETVVPLDGAGTNTPLAAVPTAAVVRALDAGGRGLPGKEFIPYVYVRSRVAADCLLGGVTLGAANLESPFDQPCAVQSLQAFARDHVRLEVREGEGVTHSSGKDGFLSMPLVYSTLDTSAARAQTQTHTWCRTLDCCRSST